MPDYADLEIGLSRFDGESYRVELRFSRPDDQEPKRGGGLVRFPLDKLRQQPEPEVYGRILKESLFDDPDDTELRDFVKEALAVTKDQGETLRLRLLVDRTAPELHSLRWETLRTLGDDGFLATDQNLLFSRYLYSYDWDRIQLRAERKLRALVVVANPQDLEKGEYEIEGHTLAPVDVALELERARKGLVGVSTLHELASDPGDPGRVSLENLAHKLRSGSGYDIVYLACHGALWPPKTKHQEPFLWLEDGDGNADVVPGEKLVRAIRNLYANLRPTLVVLASCQSAGTGKVPGIKTADTRGALAALGPKLAQAGIPAVVAMQGDVRMATVGEFMPVFFEELTKHGQVERAMAAAREQMVLSKCPDWWMPVLFLRLRGGLIWYVPGFAGEFEQWPGLIMNIKKEKCLPILGAGLIQFLVGSPHEIARRWADKHHFPLSPDSLDHLPQIAQYLACSQGEEYPQDLLQLHLKTELQERLESVLPPGGEEKSLSELIAILGEQRRKESPDDPYRVLAELPFPVYINANPDNLLTEALRATEGKVPQVEFARWKADLRTLPSIIDREEQYLPSVNRPLVYHLFGCIDHPSSLVVTEDDFFEYLMWINSPDHGRPEQIDAAWKTNALLFLGFGMRDWRFRVLLRSILNEERRFLKTRLKQKSVAVQIQPVEGNLRPERACRYLVEDVFSPVNTSTYWGSATDFLKDLLREWQAVGGGE